MQLLLPCLLLLSHHLSTTLSFQLHPPPTLALFSCSSTRTTSSSTSKLSKTSAFPTLYSTSTPLEDFKKTHAFSLSNPSKYWGDIGHESITWNKPFTKTLHPPSFLSTPESDGITIPKWYIDGELSPSYNMLDRHILAGRGDTAAVIYDPDTPTPVGDKRIITYNELKDSVCKVANLMRDMGVKKGDIVTVYMPMVPEAFVALLALNRLGAVHSVVFAGFSPAALADRIRASGSKYIITADSGVRAGKPTPLKKTVDAALAIPGDCGVPLNQVERVFVFPREKETSGAAFDATRDFLVTSSVLAGQSGKFEPVTMQSHDPLFVLYTSGSTGLPKAIVHTVGGYLVYAGHTTSTSFDLPNLSSLDSNSNSKAKANSNSNIEKQQVVACVADIGWITGHTYSLYGPLLLGHTTLLFESTPLFPDPGRYWEMIDKYKVNVFYTSPTAIRSLMAKGDSHVLPHDTSSLKVLGVVGEVINPKAYEWYKSIVGKDKVPVVDTYWQTESGGHLALPLPFVHTPGEAGGEAAKPGSCKGGTYGIDLRLLDPVSGKDITHTSSPTNEIEGVLAVKAPWPGMAQTLLNDHSRFISTYFSPYKGYYFTGDGARKDAHGDYWVTGRVDDVINSSGHRIGTAEVESALVGHGRVAQAAVVAFPHVVKGEGIACYVTLNDYSGSDEGGMTEELRSELKQAVRKAIGPFATPDLIVEAKVLPMTRSGKIMRRILRKLAAGEGIESLGDVSTLADSSCIASIEKAVTIARGAGAK